MDNERQHKRKTFKPLVLFHNNDSGHINQDSNYHSLVEQHRLKTIDMLNYNSQLWESSVNNDSFETTVSGQVQRNIYHMSTVNASSWQNSAERQRNNSKPIIYEKVTPAPRPKNSTSERQNKTEKKPIIGTNFIVEPQYHLIYNPHFGKKRKRENLPKNVTEFLKEWLLIHKKHPYPTEKEKQDLAEETRLTVSQISNWFINARRRILQPLLDSESTTPQQSTTSQQSTSQHERYNYNTRYDIRNDNNLFLLNSHTTSTQYPATESKEHTAEQ